MSNYDFENEYEDELDRMRAQRKRKKEQRGSRSGQELSHNTDPDFQIEYLDEDWDTPSDHSSDYNEEINSMSVQRSHTYRRTQSAAASPRKHASHSQPAVQTKRSAKQGPSYPSKKRIGKKKKGRALKLILLALILITAGLYGKRWMKDRDGYWNIAVFGVDSRDSNLGKGSLADVQMIASINKKTGEIRLVSVFRDTYVQINDDGDFHKINEAYFKGGHQQALDTLKRNLDIIVDDYATFNWKAVADAINILGGIDLEITDSEFAYINSFITETVESTGVYSQHLQSAGMNHLDGVQAVAYSRLRLMDTDFNRTERQRKVVSLALEKAKQADFNMLKTVAGTVIPEISTSIGIEDIIPLAKNVNRYHLGQTAGFPFAKTTAMVGKMDCVIPMTLESNVVLLHQFLFDAEEYQPSSSVHTISGIISEKTGIYEEGKSAGADTNLTGGSSGNSSGNSGSSGSSVNAGNAQGSDPASQIPDQQVQDTQESEESLEESGNDAETRTNEADESQESNESDENSPTEKGETAEEGNHGSGQGSNNHTTVVEPLSPDEPTLSQEQIQEGPGSLAPTSGSPNVSHTKPAEVPTENYGPGFDNP